MDATPVAIAEPHGGLSDLHRHLDGSLRPSTLSALAAASGQQVPPNLPFSPGMGLAAALSRFAFTLSVLQDARSVRRVAAELCEDAEAEGVTTLEIRFAPQLHRGAPPEAIVEAALEGIAGRAGLVLCGLYGEAPGVLAALLEVARERPGVVGIDLAGGPVPGHAWGLLDYAPTFSRAKDLGIGRTVHAGEGRPPAEIRLAVERLHAERIGHGCSVLDDPSVVDLLLDRGVTLEACPTSNVHTGIFPSVAAHPLPLWLARGLKVCVNTDNTLLSAVDAPEEYRRVAAIPGMTAEGMERVVAAGHVGRFVRGRASA